MSNIRGRNCENSRSTCSQRCYLNRAVENVMSKCLSAWGVAVTSSKYVYFGGRSLKRLRTTDLYYRGNAHDRPWGWNGSRVGGVTSASLTDDFQSFRAPDRLTEAFENCGEATIQPVTPWLSLGKTHCMLEPNGHLWGPLSELWCRGVNWVWHGIPAAMPWFQGGKKYVFHFFFLFCIFAGLCLFYMRG